MAMKNGHDLLAQTDQQVSVLKQAKLRGHSVATASGRKPGPARMANSKSFGWAIYAAGFVIWCFGYLSGGHAPVFDWDLATPWWISSFIPSLEAELGLGLMLASMVPIYWRAGVGRRSRECRRECED